MALRRERGVLGLRGRLDLDKRTLLTSQLFFDEKVNAAVYRTEPYSKQTGRDVFNDSDGIFDASLVVTARRAGDGWLGVMYFDVDRS